MTEMWHVGGAECNIKKMHWAGKNEKGEGPASTSLVGVMNMERWGHQSMELEGGGRPSL